MTELPVACDTLNFVKQEELCDDRFMILLLLEGELDFSVQDSYFRNEIHTFRMSSADVFILHPMCTADIVPNTRNLMLRIRLQSDFLYQAFGTDFIDITCNSALKEGDYAVLRRRIALVYESYGISSAGGELHLFSALYQLLETIYNDYTESYLADTKSDADHAVRMREIVHYLRTHYKDPLTLQMAADHMNLSAQYFSRYFKRNFGTGFLKYLTNLRLDYVCQDLRSSKAKITHIAFENGFTNLNSFGRAFQERYGMTPREYRSRAKNREKGYLVRQCSAEDLHLQTYMEELSDVDTDSSGLAVFRKYDTADADHTVNSHDVWRDCINLHRAKNCMTVEFQNQLLEVQQKLHFRYARMNSIFDSEMISLDQDNIMCGFSGFARIIDFLRRAGLHPCLDLSLRPVRIDLLPEVSYEMEKANYAYSDEQWKILLELFLSSCMERWGLQWVSSWRFEFCYDHERENISLYTKRYLMTQEIFDRMLPEAYLGGPCFEICSEELEVGLDQLRDLKRNGAHPDFISFSMFPDRIYHREKNEDGAQFQYTVSLVGIIYGTDDQPKRESMAGLRDKIYEIFPYKPKLHLVEYSSSWSSRTQLNDSIYKNAYIIRAAVECAGEVDGMAHWYFSDLSCEEDSSSKPLFGGNGMITRDGLKKGSYYALWFLSRLGDRCIKRGENFMLFSSGSGSYELVVHNIKRWRQEYCQYLFREPGDVDDSLIFENLYDMDWQLTLNNIEPGQYLIRHSVMNKHTGDLKTEMSKLCLNEYLREEDKEYLTHVSVPKQKHFTDYCADRRLVIRARLAANEVRLITVTRTGI